MEVILLQKVANLGVIGDRVKVKSGYGRNYLLPTGRATLATEANIKRFEAIRADLEKQAAASLGSAQKRAETLNGLKVTVTAKAGTEGRLFGSVGTTDIAEAVTRMGHQLSRAEVRMPAGPLRQVGDHNVAVHLHADVDVNLIVSIVAEEQA